jgi:UDP-GlcNAc:undecaprenyl-phosphate GlcNAc-1-phosphate transferase
MYALTLATVACASFILALILTPLSRYAATRAGWVDAPDFRRKIHRAPIPRIGGIPVFLGFAGALLILLAIGGRDALGGSVPLSAALSIAPGAAVVFLIGLADDIFALRPWQKLAVEVVAGLAAVGCGVHISNIAGFELHPVLSAVATVLWLLLCTNALNLIDGMDGLATGVGLFAAVTTLLAAILQNNLGLAVATAPLAGALLGFLRYNFNPATIFLGDCGSLTIGFLLGCHGILWSQKSATMLGMTAPLMVLAVPLLDTVLAIARRFLRRQPIFGADRGHIHHRLLDRGLTPRRAVLLIYGFCALGAMCSIAMMNHHLAGFIIIGFCVVTWMAIQQLGYAEFKIAGRMLLTRGAFRRRLNAEITLKGFQDRLSAAATPNDCWGVIQGASDDFGFHDIRLQLAGRVYEQRNGLGPNESWVVRIPITERDWIEVTRAFGVDGPPSSMAPLADMLRKTLAAKVAGRQR